MFYNKKNNGENKVPFRNKGQETTRNHQALH